MAKWEQIYTDLNSLNGGIKYEVGDIITTESVNVSLQNSWYAVSEATKANSNAEQANDTAQEALDYVKVNVVKTNVEQTITSKKTYTAQQNFRVPIILNGEIYSANSSKQISIGYSGIYSIAIYFPNAGSSISPNGYATYQTITKIPQGAISDTQDYIIATFPFMHIGGVGTQTTSFLAYANVVINNGILRVDFISTNSDYTPYIASANYSFVECQRLIDN